MPLRTIQLPETVVFIGAFATVHTRLVKLLKHNTRNLVEKLNGLVKPLSLGVGISFTPQYSTGGGWHWG